MNASGAYLNTYLDNKSVSNCTTGGMLITYVLLESFTWQDWIVQCDCIEPYVNICVYLLGAN